MIAERLARIEANSALAVAVAMGMPQLRALGASNAIMGVMADAGNSVKCDLPEGALVSERKEAIEEYVTNSFGLNAGLRSGSLTPAQGGLSSALDAQMAPLGTVQGAGRAQNIIYRSIPKEDAPAFVAGRSFVDPAFVSTSKSRTVARNIAEDAFGEDSFIMLRIHTKPGTLGIDVNSAVGDFGGFAWQEEVLLARNTRFRINEIIHERGGTTVVDMTVQ